MQAEDPEVRALRVENAALLQRVESAEAAIAELRAEALLRRQQVRELVADLPVAISRKTLLRQIIRDGFKHPDKRGVVTRATNKVRRDVGDSLRPR